MAREINGKIMTSTQELEDRIGNRFCPPAWAFLPQVRRGTGYATEIRTADAIAMSLYPSRGLFVHGFEIKVSRFDWTNEFKNPDKAEAIAQFCDFWWVVAPKDTIKLDELPTNWGLFIPFGKTLKAVKQAVQLKPKRIDKNFLAAILRRTQECITPDAKLIEVIEKARKEGEEDADKDFNYERDKHKELEDEVAIFEKASGVKIRHEWNREEIGEAVRMVLDSRHLRLEGQLKDLLGTAETIVTNLKVELKKTRLV